MAYHLTVPYLDTNFATVEQLRKYADDLRFKLEELLPPDRHIITLQTHYKLTKQQAIILAALANGRLWSTDQLLATSAKWNAEIGRTVITVQIYHLRRRLPQSFVISSEFGIGYRLTSGVEEVQTIIAGASHETKIN